MISDTRSEQTITVQVDVPLDVAAFTRVTSELTEIEKQIKEVQTQCRKKLRKLRVRKKQLQSELLERKQKQNAQVKEVKRFDDGKKELWLNGQLLQTIPLKKEDLQVSLFDYLDAS